MSVTTAVPSRLKASDGRRIAPTKSALAPRYSRTAAFCLSSVKWVVTRARTPPGFRASTDLAKKKSWRAKLCPDNQAVNRRTGRCRRRRRSVLQGAACRGSSRCGRRVRDEAPGDASRGAVEFDADEPHPLGPWLRKLPVPQPGSRTVAWLGTPRRAMAWWMLWMTSGEV